MVIKGFRHLFFLVFMLSSVAIIAEPVVVKPQSAIHSTNKASWADYLSIHKLFNRCKNYFGYGLAKESASEHVAEVISQPKIIKKTMVVFVHGTLRPRLERCDMMTLLTQSPQFLLKAAQQSRSETQDQVYQLMMNHWLESRDLTLHRQALQGLGLRQIESSANEQSSMAASIAQKFDEHYSATHDSSENLLYYTFGWSGMLHARARAEASYHFYKGLIQERDRLKASGVDQVKIIIMAHSHGGNVSLLLADQEEKLHQELAVNKLFLFGTPVHCETEMFVHSPVFKKVYSISSYGDAIQGSDLVSTGAWVCKRTFTPLKQKSDRCSKLIQIKVSLTAGGRSEVHPTHTELWAAAHPDSIAYRNDFPLHPFPLVVLVPHISRMVHDHLEKRDYLHLLIDVHQKELCMSLYDRRAPQSTSRLRGTKKVSFNQLGNSLAFAMAQEVVAA